MGVGKVGGWEEEVLEGLEESWGGVAERFGGECFVLASRHSSSVRLDSKRKPAYFDFSFARCRITSLKQHNPCFSLDLRLLPKGWRLS